MRLESERSAVPETIAFEILHGCNLACRFCYVAEESPGVQERIRPPLKCTFEILDLLRASGVREVYLVGGEPTAHPEFQEICLRIAELDFPLRGIVTNGTLLTERKVALLHHLGFWVDVSVRSLDETSHRQLVGRVGALRTLLKGLALLTEAGVSVGIEYDCVKDNSRDLYCTISKLRELGIAIKHVFLHRIAPHGVASSGIEPLSLEDYRTLLEQAERVRAGLGIPVTFEDGLPLCLFEPAHWDHIVACECGRTLATVDPTGNVRKCACHPETLGNLLQEDLSRIWLRALKVTPTSLDDVDPCASCVAFERCRGGCASSSPGARVRRDVFFESFQPIPRLHRPMRIVRIRGQALEPVPEQTVRNE